MGEANYPPWKWFEPPAKQRALNWAKSLFRTTFQFQKDGLPLIVFSRWCVEAGEGLWVFPGQELGVVHREAEALEALLPWKQMHNI